MARAVEGLRKQRQKFEDARENGAAVSPTPRGKSGAEGAGGSLRAQVGLHSISAENETIDLTWQPCVCRYSICRVPYSCVCWYPYVALPCLQAAVAAAAEEEERDMKDLQRRRQEIDKRLASLVESEGGTSRDYESGGDGGGRGGGRALQLLLAMS